MKNIKDLKKILRKAVITPNLRNAVEEIIKAIESKNIELAYQLSACKSLIASYIPPQSFYTFGEEADSNRKELDGYSVYEMLDSIHHDMAWSTSSMPSGMIQVSGAGITEFEAKGEHPIVRQIKYEKECVRLNMP